MKPEQEGADPESDDCEPAATKIADHDSCFSDTIHFAEECDGVPIVEVVQNLRCEHYVKRFVYSFVQIVLKWSL